MSVLMRRPKTSLLAAVHCFILAESRCRNKTTIKLESRENWPERHVSRRSGIDGPLVQNLPARTRRKHQRRTPSSEIRLLGTEREAESLERCRGARGACWPAASRQSVCADRSCGVSFSSTTQARYGIRGRGGEHPNTAISRAASTSASVFHVPVPLRRLRRRV